MPSPRSNDALVFLSNANPCLLNLHHIPVSIYLLLCYWVPLTALLTNQGKVVTLT